MKKLMIFGMLLVAAVFTACSSSDDDATPFDATGVYVGDMDITLAGMEVADDIAQSIYITDDGDDTISLELKDFEFEGVPIGDIKVADITVIKSGNGCSFIGFETITLESVGDCDIDVYGDIEGDELDVTINVAVTALGVAVTVDFDGER